MPLICDPCAEGTCHKCTHQGYAATQNDIITERCSCNHGPATIVEERPADIIFPERRTVIASNRCTTCFKPAVEFKDDLSRREYRISGMCQACQDGTFTDPGDECPSYCTEVDIGVGIQTFHRHDCTGENCDL